MHVLITGSAGFIGNALALRLVRSGVRVSGVDSMSHYYDVSLKRDRLARLDGVEGFAQHHVDIRDMEALSRVFADDPPDRVVHLAAQAGVRHSLEHPRDYVDTNLVGSFNVLELCRAHDVGHLVLASTSSAYGANDQYPFHETDRAAHPLTIYAATKLGAEMMAHSYAHLHHMPTTAVRFFTVYGPWGRPDMAPMLFAERMFGGRAIDVFNEGRMERDFTYIDDLVEGIARLLDTPPERGAPVSGIADSLSPVAPYRLVNIGNAAPVALMDFIGAMEDAVGRPARKNMMEMQRGDVVRTFARTELLQALTGFSPATDIRTGVSRFIDWYRDYYGHAPAA